MKSFTLNQLRNDVLDHVDLPTSLLNGSSFWSTSWIDWILTQMIGSTEYQLLSDYPYTRVRFIPVDQDTTLTLSLS